MKNADQPITEADALTIFRAAKICANARTVKRHLKECQELTGNYHNKRWRLGDVSNLAARLAKDKLRRKVRGMASAEDMPHGAAANGKATR